MPEYLSSAINADYVQMAVERPWDYGFMSLVRWFDARYQTQYRIGQTLRPSQDAIRLGQHPSVSFSPRELACVQIQNGRIKIEHLGLGLWGANGPLPLHFSEIAMHRKEMVHDHTLTNFVDIFHHRSFSLFYRAWLINQSTAGLDRKDDERFSRYIAWLTGNEYSELVYQALPAHAKLSASVHSVAQSKSTAAITQTLSQYFKTTFVIEEYYFQWMRIDQRDATRLGQNIASHEDSNRLGIGAMLGAHIPDCQHNFLLVVGPLSLAQYKQFLPRGSSFVRLVEWVRHFVGFEYSWHMRLTIDAKQVQPMRLGPYQKLGRDTWIGQAKVSNGAVVGATVEPEQYTKSL